MAGGERTLLRVLLPGLTFLFLFGSVQGQTACRCDATTAGSCKDTAQNLLSEMIIDCPNLLTNLTCVYSSLAGCSDLVATPVLTALNSSLSTNEQCTGLPTFSKCTDPCATSPCQNGGQCSPSSDGTSYTCTCTSGFEGDRCETNKDDCAGSPCKNGGVCSDGDASFSCACAPGFNGTTCETNINDCKADSCQNGGTCEDGVNSFTCTCLPFYSGQTCHTLEADIGPNLAAVGGIVGGALALLLVVIVVIAVWKLRVRRERRKAEDNYSGLHLETREAPRDQSAYGQLQGHRNPAGPHPDPADPYYSELGPLTPDPANPYYSGLDPATKVKAEPAPYEKLGKLQTTTGAHPRSGAGTEKRYDNAAHPVAEARPGPQSYYYNFASRQSEQR